MSTESRHPHEKIKTSHDINVPCYHCGEVCPDLSFKDNENHFCCQGCLSVYQLLNNHQLGQYYELNQYAGNNLRKGFRNNQFAYLEDPKILEKIIKFREASVAHVVFHIPKIHCSSCIYLLEHLPRLLKGVIRTDIQFLKREAKIIFNEQEVTLREVVEFLTSLGYEPHISLQSLEEETTQTDKTLIYKLGVAGFCFGNIMLLSLPEYFDQQIDPFYGKIFMYLSFGLSLLVFFYSATEFFTSAIKGLKHKYLNIDFGISLAVVLTFGRSLYQVFIEGTGGYFDSMSGIVFWMLVGRVLQQKTYQHISFKRSYTDYFPISATKILNGQEVPTPLPDLKEGDVLLVHHQELIPADGILMEGKAQIDYSFVTGESLPVSRQVNELIYAGGKQLGEVLKIRLSKGVETSYLTSLWMESNTKHVEEEKEKQSFVQVLAQYFTWIVLAISFIAAAYWFIVGEYDTGWRALTSVLIVACPCALLLTATFTEGYFIRILSKNGFFLRKASLIEFIAQIKHVVFDKTGTLTSAEEMEAHFVGTPLSHEQIRLILSLAKPSTHTFVKPVQKMYQHQTFNLSSVQDFKEHTGLGLEGYIDGRYVKAGVLGFFKDYDHMKWSTDGTAIFISIEEEIIGYYLLRQGLRKGIAPLFGRLKEQDYNLSLLTGDYNYEYQYLRQQMGEGVEMHFEQLPKDKLSYIKELQAQNIMVAMVGDGLNDAGALSESDLGICVVEEMENFSPAGDAILDAKNLHYLDRILQFCKKHKRIIHIAFMFSILYNLIGIYFAVQGLLSPLIAAILMPLSTLSIVLITFVGSRMYAKRLALKR